ncbi:DUF3885 domain-containing protein [Paucibacter sp. M5-1]|uniref:DUF3885 domain-containing protein n=1 Tax=Paucibacter sp. M5-1 TaxID=3015998 RepID=UPI0022B8ABC5|nr:DUF3885 domain-containing protein [Paucibacter sp. M5-1]MCZ7883436.1 DUF3885 domain-containing protein [Paucibacter sp. M5-1]
MSLRTDIERIFHGKVFVRPLFYEYGQALRFELSEGDSAIAQFLSALNKALTICEDIFAPDEDLVVCLRFWHDGSRFEHRKMLRELRAADIRPPRARCLWDEPVPEEDRIEEGLNERWANIAFSVPRAKLQNLLWCALSHDFSSIRPNPGGLIYLFDLSKEIAVWPYDDRGMDVAGNDTQFLASLYKKHERFLLDHDRSAMDAKFGIL